MFYPILSRRLDYSTTGRGKYYADYTRYRDEVMEDCDNRCCYCDILLLEHGGEGFQLDHFRPQKRFPELKSDPNNLVVSCPVCNRKKSDFWPETYPSIRFIDPFESNRTDRFIVVDSGEVTSNTDMLANYQIILLDLNRPYRVLVRRRRILIKQLKESTHNIALLLHSMEEGLSVGNLNEVQKRAVLNKCKLCSELMSDVNTMLNIL